MSNIYTLTNTAQDIDSAITRVTSADTEPTANSQNMITSQGVKTAVDGLDSRITDMETGFGFPSGYTGLTNSGTATSAGFLLIQVGGVGSGFSTVSVSITIGSTSFSAADSGPNIQQICLPIAKDESYSVIASSTTNLAVPITVRFKKLKLT